jgi:cyanophycin synthetase
MSEKVDDSEKIVLPKITELKIVKIETIEGKNKWHSSKEKLIQMVLDLNGWEEFPSNKIPNFTKSLKEFIPSMIEHRCSEGHRGGFFSRLDDGTWLGHIIEHIALELQTLIGHDTGFGRTRGAGKKGVYNVVFECFESEIGVAAAKSAVKIAKAIIQGKDPEIEEKLMQLKNLLKKSKD